MIRRLHHVIVDCPDPPALAAFYSELLGLPVTWLRHDFAVVASSDTSSGIAFQLAPGHQPPRWPDPRSSQQVHLDVMVDDVDVADPAVLALGARRLPSAGGSRVYADPAGHPFCLIPRPAWAPAIGASKPRPAGGSAGPAGSTGPARSTGPAGPAGSAAPAGPASSGGAAGG